MVVNILPVHRLPIYKSAVKNIVHQFRHYFFNKAVLHGLKILAGRKIPIPGKAGFKTLLRVNGVGIFYGDGNIQAAKLRCFAAGKRYRLYGEARNRSFKDSVPAVIAQAEGGLIHDLLLQCLCKL